MIKAMLTVKQGSQRLGVSLSKMYEIIARQKIAHYRIEGKIMLSEEDLDSYLKSCRIEAGARTPARSPQVYRHLNPSRLAKAWKERGVLPSP
jgi:excisionase family DNA binding protein